MRTGSFVAPRNAFAWMRMGEIPRNEAAERLRRWLTVDGRYTDAHPMVDRLVDEALATERRATVDRIRERIGITGSAPYTVTVNPFDLVEILDEESGR